MTSYPTSDIVSEYVHFLYMANDAMPAAQYLEFYLCVHCLIQKQLVAKEKKVVCSL